MPIRAVKRAAPYHPTDAAHSAGVSHHLAIRAFDTIRDSSPGQRASFPGLQVLRSGNMALKTSHSRQLSIFFFQFSCGSPWHMVPLINQHN
jgi:hypothetical protein